MPKTEGGKGAISEVDDETWSIQKAENAKSAAHGACRVGSLPDLKNRSEKTTVLGRILRILKANSWGRGRP